MANRYANEGSETKEDRERRNAAIANFLGDAGESNVAARAVMEKRSGVNVEIAPKVLTPISIPSPAKKPGDAGYESPYARKRAWCMARGVWGWEVPEPKPWK